MLIGISGYAGSGKDTTGELLRYLIAKQHHQRDPRIEFNSKAQYTESGWLIKKFADPLREVAAVLLGMSLDYLYTDKFKTSTLPEQWNTDVAMTGREFLQKLGTDAVRYGLHTNSWVNALMADYKGVPATILHDDCPVSYSGVGFEITEAAEVAHSHVGLIFPNWIITDMRFPNEMEAIKKRGGITIRVNRYPLWVDQDAFDAWRNAKHESETALDNAEFDYIINNEGTDFEHLETQLIPITTKLQKYEQTHIY